MAKMLLRFSQPCLTMMTLQVLLLLLSFSGSVSAEPQYGTQAEHIGTIPFPRSIIKRVNDRNDASKDWWPFMGLEMQLPRAKMQSLPNSEAEKRKLLTAARGLGLLCRMKSPVSSPPLRADFMPGFGRPAEAVLANFGWESTPYQRVQNLENYGLRAAFEDLGISQGSENWIKSIIMHARDSEDAFNEYPATSGSFDSLFNLKDGVLISAVNWSPQTQILKPEYRHIPLSRLVPLRNWSDVVWLHREQIIVDLRQVHTAAPLEHVFRHCIVNTDAEQIFQMVTGKQKPSDIGGWPGMSYPIGEPQALATLASPNGSGVAWLLIQHKGSKSRMIDRINIFDCAQPQTASGQWCLYLHIVDA